MSLLKLGEILIPQHKDSSPNSQQPCTNKAWLHALLIPMLGNSQICRAHLPAKLTEMPSSRFSADPDSAMRWRVTGAHICAYTHISHTYIYRFKIIYLKHSTSL